MAPAAGPPASCGANANTIRTWPFDILVEPGAPKTGLPASQVQSGHVSGRCGGPDMDAIKTGKIAKLTIGDQNWDFPVMAGSIGPDGRPGL